MSPRRRLGALVASVAALAAAAWAAPLDAIPDAVARLGPAAPVAGVLLGASLLIGLVPRTPISVACGLLFGPTTGSICALAVTMVAAAVTFLAGRILGRQGIQHWAHRAAGRRGGRAWAAIEQWIAREGVLAVAAVRSLPLAPFGLVGYAYGASGVRVRDYAVGTLLASSPSAVTYALLGAAVVAEDAAPFTLLPLVIGVALSTAVALRTRRHLRASHGRSRAPAGQPTGTVET
jgi:uncharacterized membrane protein YdjX (TVP38/TMEM64 family)